MAASSSADASRAPDAVPPPVPPPVPPRRRRALLSTPSYRPMRASEPPSRARVRSIRIPTKVHPDMLVPYLYSDRPYKRSVNSIGHATQCTIDYCALSPQELELSLEQGFGLDFLVSGCSRRALDAATSQLQTLVERVQQYLLQKTGATGGQEGGAVEGASEVDEERALRVETGRDEHWRDGGVDGGGRRLLYDAAASRAPVEFPGRGNHWERVEARTRNQVEAMEVEEKTEEWERRRRRRKQGVERHSTMAAGGDDDEEEEDDDGGGACFVQHRDQAWPYSGSRGRVRRDGMDSVRYVPRKHLRERRDEDGGYAAYAVAPAVNGSGQSFRMLRHQQNVRLYQGPPEQFERAEFSRYGGGRLESDNDADIEVHEEANESMDANARFYDRAALIPDQFRSMYQPHPCRSLKRPLSKVQRNGAVTPPSVYRKRIPYVYDYAYDSREDDWMTEEEGVDDDYVYPPQLRPLDVPVVRQQRRVECRSSGQWANPVKSAPQRFHKRRRVPPERFFADEGVTGAYSYGMRSREHTFSPVANARTGQLYDVVADVGSSAFRERSDTYEQILAEEESTASSSSAAHTADDVRAANNATTAGEEPADAYVENEPHSPTRETQLDQQDLFVDEEELQATTDNTTAGCRPSPCTSQMETVAPESAEKTEDGTASALSQKPAALGGTEMTEDAVAFALSQKPVALEGAEMTEDGTASALPQKPVALEDIKMSEDAVAFALSQKPIALEGTEMTEDGTASALLQKSVVLEGTEMTEDATAFTLSQKPVAPSSSPSHLLPVSHETDCSELGNDVSAGHEADLSATGHDVPAGHEADLSALGSDICAERENSHTNVGDGGRLDSDPIVQVPIFVESTVGQQCTLIEGRPLQSAGESVVTDTIGMNDHVIESLKRLSEAEAAFVIAKRLLSTQAAKLRRVESRSNRYRRLKVLCDTVCYLKCHVGSHLRGTNAFHNQDLLDRLERFLERITIRDEQTLYSKVDALQAELDGILAVVKRVADDRVTEGKRQSIKRSGAVNDSTVLSVSTDKHRADSDDAHGTTLEDGDWLDVEVPCDLASKADTFVAQNLLSKSNPKSGGGLVKLEKGIAPCWPRELPLFIRSMLSSITSFDPQSYVMRVTHKQLLDEIAKGDPYYYLHPKVVRKVDAACMPMQSSASPGCEFGCRGASALKWKQKLVSQISARMKMFDEVAYSLARSSGGNEVLNRKKMNSIIRKLHLVAVQLHSLMSHLYCLKGLATCKEVDSVPMALNNAYFERKMGVYKSRLKLVAPHTYRQHSRQQQQQRHQNSPSATDELLRDTYEFLPELLLCVDIWGYNYRESPAKRHNCKDSHIAGPVGSKAISMGAMFPLGYFREVESLTFDFEHDDNGLLRSVCDELLNVVCLWNDFKWTNNFEAMTSDRVMSFESDVTSSILKIFELHAHHLQALWSVSLLDEPEQLLGVNFTHPNAYYSDRSRGSLSTTACSQPGAVGLSTSPGETLNSDLSSVDKQMTTEIVEQRLAADYWDRKVTALSLHSSSNCTTEVDVDSVSSELLDVQAICSWDRQTRISNSLRLSDAYAIRSEIKALSAVTNHMMRNEVQNVRLSNRDVTSDDDMDQTMVKSSSRQLLAAVGRAQLIMRDVLIGSEKLALHSASIQLVDEEKRHEATDLSVSGTDRAGQKGSHVPVQDAPSRRASVNRSNGNVCSEGADSESTFRNEDTASEDLNRHGGVDANADVGLLAEQPELQDLVRLLAITKQSVQELCSRRPRSARMREKVQVQSLQLAHQAVEIFRNMRNMYASQRR
uniref:Uncharacterized protein n=1 Tax=Peronospora matthiolae TaxID=2874970 RepID=A0AAV1UHJ1_9STRA